MPNINLWLCKPEWLNSPSSNWNVACCFGPCSLCPSSNSYKYLLWNRSGKQKCKKCCKRNGNDQKTSPVLYRDSPFTSYIDQWSSYCTCFHDWDGHINQFGGLRRTRRLNRSGTSNHAMESCHCGNSSCSIFCYSV